MIEESKHQRRCDNGCVSRAPPRKPYVGEIYYCEKMGFGIDTNDSFIIEHCGCAPATTTVPRSMWRGNPNPAQRSQGVMGNVQGKLMGYRTVPTQRRRKNDNRKTIRRSNSRTY